MLSTLSHLLKLINPPAKKTDPAAKRPRAEQQPEEDEEEEEDELVAMLATQVDVAPSAAPPPPPPAAETEKEARGEKETAAEEEEPGTDAEEEEQELGLPGLCRHLLHPCKAAGDVVDGEAFPITSGASGERVYLSFGPPHVRGALAEAAAKLERARAASSQSSFSSSSSSSRSAKCLLSAPLSVLQDQAERDALERALAAVEDRDMQEARAAEAERAAAAAGGPSSSSGAGAASAAARPHAASPPSLLWVDKYAPRSFMELLSDEQVNREVLKWVKSWHGVVFGSGGGGGNQSSSFNGGDGRPEHKILLLAGPPGLGKTTLAHVVARHCGYLPIEINASDERSATALQARVRDATELAAGGGLVADRDGGRRPACVIVDEIDGAAGGPEGRSAVAALLRIVQATGGGGGGKKGGRGKAAAAAAPSSKRGDGGGGDDSDDSDREGDDEAAPASSSHRSKGGPSSKKGSSSSGPGRLLRPIIAICNDAFAPALRPLRSVALVVHIRPPATNRLVSRLRAVCAAENVRADRRALVAVAESSGRDVRSCLHGLQLLAGRSLAAAARARAEAAAAAAAAAAGGGGGGLVPSPSSAAPPPPRVITYAAAASLRSGAKDAKQSAFDVWGALLHAGAPGPRFGGSVAARSAAAAAASASRGKAGGASRQQQHHHHRTASSLLWDAVSDFGDADLLLRGLHESLPRLRLADGRASRLAAATEALAAADAAATRGVAGSGASGGGGDWALAAFAPLGLLRFRAAVAGPDRPRVAWPALFADAERGRAANAAALAQWARSLPAGLRASGTAACSGSRALVSDVAPALLRVASAPGTRPVARHLLSRAEARALEGAVATLAAYNLTYSPRTAKDSFHGSFVPFGAKRDGFGNDNQSGAPLAVGGPAAAFAAAFAAAAESGAYGGSMMMMAASNQQQRQPSAALASASSLSSAGSLASASSSSLPFGVGGGLAAPPLREGDLDLFPTVISDVVSFGLGRPRPGASLPQPARALLASEVAQEVIRRREAAFAEKGGPAGDQQQQQQQPGAAAAKGAAGDRRVSSAGTSAPAPLTLAERAAQSGAAARAALAAQQDRERKGTWLDQIRGRASKRRAGVLAAAAVRAAASVAETQERQMALAAGGEGGGAATAAANSDDLSPGALACKAAAPKAVYRFNEGYTNAVRRPVRVRDML